VQVEVLSSAGKGEGTVELPSHLFEANVSEYALYRAVVAYEANQRQGTAAVKTRAEVSRTSKKHHRQKGTGQARLGSLKSPAVKGGGVAFGPVPRSYRTQVPKGLKQRALSSALSLKGRAGMVRVVADFELSAPSTKSFKAVIDACGLSGQRLLFVTPESSQVLLKSGRNLPGVEIQPVGTLCTYDVLKADAVLFTRQALGKLSQVFAGTDKE
jgi:large subunit ribosomal protein L4